MVFCNLKHSETGSPRWDLIHIATDIAEGQDARKTKTEEMRAEDFPGLTEGQIFRLKRHKSQGEKEQIHIYSHPSATPKHLKQRQNLRQKQPEGEAKLLGESMPRSTVGRLLKSKYRNTDVGEYLGNAKKNNHLCILYPDKLSFKSDGRPKKRDILNKKILRT